MRILVDAPGGCEEARDEVESRRIGRAGDEYPSLRQVAHEWLVCEGVYLDEGDSHDSLLAFRVAAISRGELGQPSYCRARSP
jgi:hypothetical protein